MIRNPRQLAKSENCQIICPLKISAGGLRGGASFRRSFAPFLPERPPATICQPSGLGVLAQALRLVGLVAAHVFPELVTFLSDIPVRSNVRRVRRVRPTMRPFDPPAKAIA